MGPRDRPHPKGPRRKHFMTSDDKEPRTQKHKKMVSRENRNRKKTGKRYSDKKWGNKRMDPVLNVAHHGSNQPRLGLVFKRKQFFQHWAKSD